MCGNVGHLRLHAFLACSPYGNCAVSYYFYSDRIGSPYISLYEVIGIVSSEAPLRVTENSPFWGIGIRCSDRQN
jgi:hypothetical protein